MKSTNLIFTPSSAFSNFSFFSVLLRSFFFYFFGISFLLLVPKTKRNQKSEIFSFPIKLSTNMVDTNPSPWKSWTCGHASTIHLLLNFLKLFSFNCIFYRTFKYLIALFIGTTNPHICILNSCTILLNNHSCIVIVN